VTKKVRVFEDIQVYFLRVFQSFDSSAGIVYKRDKARQRFPSQNVFPLNCSSYSDALPMKRSERLRALIHETVSIDYADDFGWTLLCSGPVRMVASDGCPWSSPQLRTRMLGLPLIP
jgi:hypothetical protein